MKRRIRHCLVLYRYKLIPEIVRVERDRGGIQYMDILNENLFTSGVKIFRDLNYPLIFQNDNDTLHCTRTMRKCFFKQVRSHRGWCLQLPDANQTENWCHNITRQILKDTTLNRRDLLNAYNINIYRYQNCKWYDILWHFAQTNWRHLEITWLRHFSIDYVNMAKNWKETSIKAAS